MRTRTVFFALLLTLAVGLAQAQEPTPTPTPKENPNAAAPTIQVDMGGGVVMTDATRSLTPVAKITVDLPVPVLGVYPFRVEPSVEIGAMPGEDLKLNEAGTWKTAGAEFLLKYVLGEGSGVKTELVAGWGFKSVLTSGDSDPSPRLARRYGGGLRISAKTNYFQLRLGHDEAMQTDADIVPAPEAVATNPSELKKKWWQRLHYLVDSRVALPVGGEVKDVLAVYVRASLGVGPTTKGSGHDIYEIGLVVNTAALLDIIRK